MAGHSAMIMPFSSRSSVTGSFMAHDSSSPRSLVTWPSGTCGRRHVRSLERAHARAGSSDSWGALLLVLRSRAVSLPPHASTIGSFEPGLAQGRVPAHVDLGTRDTDAALDEFERHVGLDAPPSVILVRKERQQGFVEQRWNLEWCAMSR